MHINMHRFNEMCYNNSITNQAEQNLPTDTLWLFSDNVICHKSTVECKSHSMAIILFAVQWASWSDSLA